MLKLNKTISITGESVIDGTPVAYMTANMSEDGGSSTGINKTITNKEIYEANKVEARKDMRDFEDEVYKIQDGMEVPAGE